MRPIALLLLLALEARASAPPSPESALGFPLGRDRTLADWNEAQRYFRALAAASDRVHLEEIGKTTEGRPFLLVTISSKENLAQLEAIRRDNLRLYDPRGLASDEAERLVARGKTIVALNHGIHATEVAASQTAMETAHWLASAEDEGTQEILRNTVVLMLPSHNPDGMQRVTDWYRSTLGAPFEGESPPFLYHHFAGHDNNRDWYFFALAESRLTVEQLYDRYRPQIVHDLHQMGTKTARLFVPPYVEPWEPNVDPALRAATNALGLHVAASLAAAGKTGIVTQAIYDAWSPSRAYPFTHGGIRLLSECASAKLATPIELKLEELEAGIGYDPRRASANFLVPWAGGRWRVRDVMDYQHLATRAVLEHAAKHRGYWLRNFLAVNRRAVERKGPFAFVVPIDRSEPWATAKLLDVLRRGGVELHRATAPFVAAGQGFAPGSWVIRMQQPASAFAKTLLESQSYPEIRPHPKAPLQPPYDVTAHTLPLLLGVPIVLIPDSFEASLERVAEPAATAGRIDGRGRLLALGHGPGDLVAAIRLLRSGVPVRWASRAFADRGRGFPAGTLLVPASARGRLREATADTGSVAHGVDSAPPARILRSPRVGLYQSFNPSMDEGWTRYVLERDAGLAYTTLHNADVTGTDLHARFDAIVLPDESPQEILEGRAAGTVPAEFSGGLGRGGILALRRFVDAGGTLVTLNKASLLALQEFPLGVVNTLPKPAEGEEAAVVGPGSILRASVSADHPIVHGLDGAASVWFEDSPAFEPTRGTALLRYTDRNPLLSGYLTGGERLEGRAALVEAPLGRGRVVLFGFRPQYRAQSWNTYVPFVNALLLAAATPSGL